jgi:hypothetical protein
VELGIYSFAEVGAGAGWHRRLGDLLEEIELAATSGSTRSARRAPSPGFRRIGTGHVLVLAERQQQIELLGEQLVVVVEIEPEQREGFDERAHSDKVRRARPEALVRH